ncbi:MAG TPA: hypothetical protein VGG96_04735, partial [Steroidobacteraceae bacterium]
MSSGYGFDPPHAGNWLTIMSPIAYSLWLCSLAPLTYFNSFAFGLGDQAIDGAIFGAGELHAVLRD